VIQRVSSLSWAWTTFSTVKSSWNSLLIFGASQRVVRSESKSELTDYCNVSDRRSPPGALRGVPGCIDDLVAGVRKFRAWFWRGFEPFLGSKPLKNHARARARARSGGKEGKERKEGRAGTLHVFPSGLLFHYLPSILCISHLSFRSYGWVTCWPLSTPATGVWEWFFRLLCIYLTHWTGMNVFVCWHLKNTVSALYTRWDAPKSNKPPIVYLESK